MVLAHCQDSTVASSSGLSGSITAPVIVSPTCGAIVRASVALAHRVTITHLLHVGDGDGHRDHVACAVWVGGRDHDLVVAVLGLVVQGFLGHQLAGVRFDVEAGRVCTAQGVDQRCRRQRPCPSRGRLCPCPPPCSPRLLLWSVSDSNMGTVIMAVTIMVAGEYSMAVSVPTASVYVAITRR